jgi:hypothetical protein
MLGCEWQSDGTYTMIRAKALKKRKNDSNKLLPADSPAHEWYRFVLSFPPHLVRHYLKEFKVNKYQMVLDPFCGTGTTLVECKKLGIPSVGIEANPMAQFASETKVDWLPDPNGLVKHASSVAEKAARFGQVADGIDLRTLSSDAQKLLLTNSISPVPLHKTLVLLDCLRQNQDRKYYKHELLALSKAVVSSISNLHFGPEVGVGPRKKDAAVLTSWLTEVKSMALDLPALRGAAAVPAKVILGDSRDLDQLLEPGSIDAVITSPPYPNEKDYTRTTRLESVLLQMIRSKADLRLLKRGLIRSNTRGVYKADNDDSWVSGHREIERISKAIEARRIELGKTSGFERLYPRVTKLYFGGIKRHLAGMRTVLAPGARLAYVVGDQASYLRIMIRTGQLLADLAKSVGYEVMSIDLFRTRLATVTKEQLREEVVLLRWPGKRGGNRH